jgi:hypothetical protein
MTFLELTRSSSEQCNYTPSGRNRSWGHVIPVQPSNQMSHAAAELQPQVRVYYTVYRVTPESQGRICSIKSGRNQPAALRICECFNFKVQLLT